ncbi:MAG TPA: DUF971 domain-containing protein [Tepidisphaeraceae bacterium]|jgi:DUF971 family protein|nr:DUF971 domain-containing protein [Tepidisphaeraceae bacterium]
MDPSITPLRLDLHRDKQLEIEWRDGHVCVYAIGYLRTMCPCAQCKIVREGQRTRKTSLKILPGNYAAPVTAVGAEMVGNYAIRIDWSDQHGSGIYSFQYLRDICPDHANPV